MLALTVAVIVLALLRAWPGGPFRTTALLGRPAGWWSLPARSPPGWPRVSLCVLRI